MKIIRQQDLIRGVAALWKGAYFDRLGKWYGEDKRAIWEKLAALPSNATADDVASAIGNRSWTTLKCDECGDEVTDVLQVGQEPDYESATVDLCFYCVTLAYRAIG